MKISRLLGACLLVVASTVWAADGVDTHAKGAEPARIAQGERVELSDYLVPGKTTIFDFTSQYCPPCRAIAPMVEQLHKSRNDIAVISVDINRPGVERIDFASPVAQQYSLPYVPYFKVYGPSGELLAEGDKARAMVVRWFK